MTRECDICKKIKSNCNKYPSLRFGYSRSGSTRIVCDDCMKNQPTIDYMQDSGYYKITIDGKNYILWIADYDSDYFTEFQFIYKGEG